jgi:anaerobic selenocysteine-containing dehydrogenase
MANVFQLSRYDPKPFLEIHPNDALQRDIGDGDMVSVFNDRGRVKLRAKVTEKAKPGVVAITELVAQTIRRGPS